MVFFFGDPDKPQAAGKHYNMMKFEELQALPVPRILAKPGVVFMWVTSSTVAQGVDLLRYWHLHYRGIAYIWVKTAKDGHVIEGQGIRPSFIKPTSELVLIGATNKTGRALPLMTENQGQIIFAPRGAHSEKPIEVKLRIEELFGEVPRLEMFARTKSQGWDAWGLETDSPMAADEAHSSKLREILLKKAEQEAQRFVGLEDLPQED